MRAGPDYPPALGAGILALGRLVAMSLLEDVGTFMAGRFAYVKCCLEAGVSSRETLSAEAVRVIKDQFRTLPRIDSQFAMMLMEKLSTSPLWANDVKVLQELIHGRVDLTIEITKARSDVPKFMQKHDSIENYLTRPMWEYLKSQTTDLPAKIHAMAKFVETLGLLWADEKTYMRISTLIHCSHPLHSQQMAKALDTAAAMKNIIRHTRSNRDGSTVHCPWSRSDVPEVYPEYPEGLREKFPKLYDHMYSVDLPVMCACLLYTSPSPRDVEEWRVRGWGC